MEEEEEEAGPEIHKTQSNGLRARAASRPARAEGNHTCECVSVCVHKRLCMDPCVFCWQRSTFFALHFYLSNNFSFTINNVKNQKLALWVKFSPCFLAGSVLCCLGFIFRSYLKRPYAVQISFRSRLGQSRPVTSAICFSNGLFHFLVYTVKENQYETVFALWDT